VSVTDVSSLSLSADGNLLLVSCHASSFLQPEIHLWDLNARSVLRCFKGHKQFRFKVEACFAGRDCCLVASGSEDSLVYVWNRVSGALLSVLEGHSSVVNAVSWNPCHQCLLASASDDNTVRLWGRLGDSNVEGAMS